jgi:hypothetical protein
MALINNVPFAPGSTPGQRTADFAALNAEKKEHIYTKLSARMCWDAVLLCAWSVKGIQCTDVDLTKNAYNVVTENGSSYDRLFVDDKKFEVTSARQLMDLSKGAFIGFAFITGNKVLRHVMIHIGNGWGAGNKNSCVLRAGKDIGWEKLDMTKFFLDDAQFNGNGQTKMIYQPVEGQTI